MGKDSKPRVVILGGGNGTSQLLKALLPLLVNERIGALHALVQTADDGGSTGRLRDQYGVAAMGDLTKCLMALSPLRDDGRGSEFLRALDYRFSGGDFDSHTLRNIFLTALEKVQPAADTESTLDDALATMARVLQVPKYSGVVPTTLQMLTEQVYTSFDDTERLLGEGQSSVSHRVNMQADPRWQAGDVRVKFAEGDVPLNPRAKEVLGEASHIIVAPGHTYGTILPTLALPALGREVAESKAKLLVVMTLLTTPYQTEGWSGEDFVRVYASYLGRAVDVVISNSGEVPVELVSGQEWVRFIDDEHAYKFIQENLVSGELPGKQRGDSVPRAVVVHDSGLVKDILEEVLFG